MSEYQYYEFLTIDRPLDDAQMRELRACSSRGTISRSRFVNHYDYGDLKANPGDWIERHFDAFLYLANWGTRQFSLKLPCTTLPPDLARQYCRGWPASARVAGDALILDFLQEDGDQEDWDDGSGWLGALVPLRTDLIAGDHRALYLAWLLCVENGEVDGDATEPPLPLGLGTLNAPLEAFVEFLQIDSDLIDVAARNSRENDAAAEHEALGNWIAALADDEKTALLLDCAMGSTSCVGGDLLRRFRSQCGSVASAVEAPPRTVAELRAATALIKAERRRREAERTERERKRREREEVKRRADYLDNLAAQQPDAWQHIDALIAERQARSYDTAVQMLQDLQDLALRDGDDAEFAERLFALRAEHRRKSTFIERLQRAELL